MVVPINQVKMDPFLVMAASVVRAQAKNTPWNGERAVLSYLPVLV